MPAQTCCGQPAFNSGDRATAREIAEQVIAAFEHYDYVVAPSGSCAGQVKTHYPELFQGDPNWQPRADVFAAKTYELTSFLADVLGVSRVDARFDGTVTYHDSCSSLRELGVRVQPRRLLGTVEGLTLKEMHEAEVCCGFGGTFCVKYPDISNVIVGKKAARHRRHRRRHAAGGRSRLPDEHRRQAAARRQDDRGPSRRRGAGRHARHAGDRRAGAGEEEAKP